MRATTLAVIAVLTAAAALAGNLLPNDPGASVRDWAIGPSSAAALPDADDEPTVVPGPMRAADGGVLPALPAARRAPPPPRAEPAVKPPPRAVLAWEGRFRPSRPQDADAGAGRALVRLPARELSFADFTVADLPDLEVWLVAADRVASADDALGAKRVSLGRLKKPRGNQTYRLPPEIDVSVYRSVIVWSRRERAPHVTALLVPQRTP
ncbi:hypothetical protein EYW49_17480 [Siculibacillus lacustris]|uniref:DM13 domain-containing protein n=1 Tax=Siculibacillus lacustris TaxID=1549641 RepID=A0A4Q9VHS4_9HYPH|nr:DM13 domain-containing protein [Siculibacillus lacustris]TBW34712.1 hypothetical protein EYW49_17480 [Siculibacillus lacustris]